jgi:nitrogen fixation protein FixH
MSDTAGKMTGRKVLIIAVSAFAVILTANMTLLYSATGSFPGLVVKNSYVAGVGWNDRAAAQRALGWDTSVSFADGTLQVRMVDRAGATVPDLVVSAVVGRPATAEADRVLELVARDGAYVAPVELGAGQWRVVLEAHDTDGAPYVVETRLYVRGGA